MKKKLTTLNGIFHSMTIPTPLKNYLGKDKYKATVTIVTEDQQTLFLEAREKTLTKINTLGIVKGDEVTIGIVFLGSEKDGRKYNNIFLNKINYLKMK